jgi:hypothetical protein
MELTQNKTRRPDMKYYATVTHYSIVGVWYKLNATTEIGAKREAWKNEGSGYIGHVVHVIQADNFEDIHRGGGSHWCREIGSGRGWYTVYR